MDRTLFEGFEETFKDFPLAHIFSHKLDCEKSGSVVKVWQDLLTEFPIDKKRVTFEVLDRVIYSVKQDQEDIVLGENFEVGQQWQT
jgi:hypothetical protein